MQRDVGSFDSAVVDVGKNVSSEVQTGGGRSNRAGVTSVDGLISLFVGRNIFPVDVRRQGHMAKSLDGSKEISHGLETDTAFSRAATGYHFRFECKRVAVIGVAKEQFLSYPDFPSWPRQALPFIWLSGDLVGK